MAGGGKDVERRRVAAHGTLIYGLRAECRTGIQELRQPRSTAFGNGLHGHAPDGRSRGVLLKTAKIAGPGSVWPLRSLPARNPARAPLPWRRRANGGSGLTPPRRQFAGWCRPDQRQWQRYASSGPGGSALMGAHEIIQNRFNKTT